MMHTVIIITVISPPTTPAIGPTSLGVAILLLIEDEVNGVILTVSIYSIKCNNSKWTESPCFIANDEGVVIDGLTVPIEITEDVDVAIVKTML